MPLVRIETRRWMSQATKSKLFDSIHRAIVLAFKISEDDRTQRLIEYAPEDFEIRPGRGEHFTIITIHGLANVTLDAERLFYLEIVKRLEPLDIPRNDVAIVIDDRGGA